MQMQHKIQKIKSKYFELIGNIFTKFIYKKLAKQNVIV